MLLASFNVTAATLLVCVALYAAIIWGIGQAVTPATARGSLVERSDGTVVGSRLIAQAFSAPRYFWPRPSAVDYRADAAGGSNKSPTSSALTERAKKIAAAYGATPENPLPPELAAASGGGLDPHITVRAARYQADRVAHARGLSREHVEALIERHAFSPGGIFTGRLVDVLEVNLALDALGRRPDGG